MFLHNILREIFMPVRCVGCGSRDTSDALCAECFAAVKLHDALFCGKCRARVPVSSDCPIKICHRDFPYLLGAATDYGHPIVKNVIHSLKFKRDRGAAQPLGDILARYISSLAIDYRAFTIIPIPLSGRRERARGFNQSAMIADVVSKNIHLPMALDILARTRHTPPQSETTSARERAVNVAGAFAVVSKISPPKNILLIDDVTTSGATFREASLALRSAGVRTIIAAAVAKA